MSEAGAASIHRVAQAGFAGTAVEYERGRPGYPQAAVDWLAERCGIAPGRTVVDVGAGTGKLTRLLVPTGAHLIAVEPLDTMRAQLVRAVPGVSALAGTAESIPLADSAADVVTAGQAFHWFDDARAARELHRILCPGGSLGLIWNIRDPTDRFQRALGQILDRYRGDAPHAYTWSGEEGAWRAPLDASGLFACRGEQRFPHSQAIDTPSLVDRIASVSFIGALAPDARADALDDVRALAASQEEPLVLQYRTAVYQYLRV
jgi:SAM-dependent methyltransferase